MCKLIYINVDVSDHIFIHVLTRHWELKNYTHTHTHTHTHGIKYFFNFFFNFCSFNTIAQSEMKLKLIEIKNNCYNTIISVN